MWPPRPFEKASRSRSPGSTSSPRHVYDRFFFFGLAFFPPGRSSPESVFFSSRAPTYKWLGPTDERPPLGETAPTCPPAFPACFFFQNLAFLSVTLMKDFSRRLSFPLRAPSCGPPVLSLGVFPGGTVSCPLPVKFLFWVPKISFPPPFPKKLDIINEVPPPPFIGVFFSQGPPPFPHCISSGVYLRLPFFPFTFMVPHVSSIFSLPRFFGPFSLLGTLSPFYTKLPHSGTTVFLSRKFFLPFFFSLSTPSDGYLALPSAARFFFSLRREIFFFLTF